MSQGRHNQPRLAVRHGQTERRAARRRRRVALWASGALVVLLTFAGVFVALQDRGVAADAGGDSIGAACTAPVPLTLAVIAEDAAPMEALAAQLASQPDGPSVPCVDLTVVRSRVSAEGVAGVPPAAAAVFGGVGPMGALSAGVVDNGAKIIDRTAVATTLAVLAMPRAMAEAAKWTDGPVGWAEITSTLLDPQAWTTLGRPDFGAFSVWLADPMTDAATRADLLGLAAGALGRPVNDLTPQSLATPEVQGALLAFDRHVTRSAPDAAGLMEALAAADVAGALASATSVAFLDEKSVWAYNDKDPTTALVAVYPEGGAASLDLTWATVEGPSVTAAQRDAADRVGAYLLSKAGQELLAGSGLRRIDGGVSAQLIADHGIEVDGGGASLRLPAAVLEASALGWQRLNNPGRFLVVVDVSGSMADPVAGTGRTKLQFAQDAAIQGIRLVPSSAEIGLWEFATALDGVNDFHELVSVGEVSSLVGDRTRLDVLVDAVDGLTPRTDTALYDTAIAAFREMRATYQPGEPNVIILITDGKNDDANTIGLSALLTAITAEQDPDRPVRLITLAYGADADVNALAKISAASGGAAFTSADPADIGAVFFKALNGS